ncbi:CHASE2 domain-containing protein [Treponema bryantii]|uniref:CHASE2 domain-containing protein n=1 Tax=Treponema bryantii TaxID=163 RepID=UPI002B2C10EF|nr:guanylate cyclase [Treponema bryantii]
MKKYTYLLIPFISVIICSLLIFTSLDNQIADLFQRTLPKLKESDSVVMVNIDDSSVNEIGTWPFSREIYADALVVLKELGSEAAIFDLSFLDKSQAKVNQEYVESELPHYVDEDFSELSQNITWLLTEAEGDTIQEDVSSVMETVQNRIKTAIQYSVRNADDSLANDLNFFENSYLTLTFGNDFPALDETTEQYLTDNLSLKNISVDKSAKVPSYSRVEPAISDFLFNSKKAGFVNADADKDGYLRRLYLIMEYNGKYYPQLLFAPILNYLGNPEIEVKRNKIILKDCHFADGTRDLKIPLAQDGTVLIKYPKNVSYYDYNDTPLWKVYRIRLLEKAMAESLQALKENGFFTYWEDDLPYEYYDAATGYIHDALVSDDEADVTYDDYFAYKEAFYEATRNFLYGDTEKKLLNSVAGDDETAAWISENMNTAREIFDDLVNSREALKNIVKNSFCIFGTCATSTTDFGLTQYEEKYPNPGVHYAIANQLLSEDFVTDSPWWISVIIAILLCFGYGFSSVKIKSTGKQLVVGGLIEGTAIILLLLFFIITKIYIGTAIPTISLAITFIAITILNFISTSKDKKFITGAFSQCLSKEVVDEIVANPSSFKLGGERVEMTAMFTDIQKFSGFSELLNAAQLVALLNFYLTKMSNLIMEERGTVDKYEGDAIIALVGAPVKMEDHAARACAAAIRMKKAEVEMNKYIIEIAAGSKSDDMEQDLYDAFKIMVQNKRTLFTRIGLNSGEMIAGYMGSENKKNYTMMGNNVNLASRLEGVNKQYHTGGILISEATRTDLSDSFLVRSLDRVQVVNVKTPIRLYELIGFKSEATDTKLTYLEEWEKAMHKFEAGDYSTALSAFKALYSQDSEDKVAAYYVELIEKFFAKGKVPTEADDFGVAYNTENPSDMNPEWVGTKYEIKGTFRLLQK